MKAVTASSAENTFSCRPGSTNSSYTTSYIVISFHGRVLLYIRCSTTLPANLWSPPASFSLGNHRSSALALFLLVTSLMRTCCTSILASPNTECWPHHNCRKGHDQWLCFHAARWLAPWHAGPQNETVPCTCASRPW